MTFICSHNESEMLHRQDKRVMTGSARIVGRGEQIQVYYYTHVSLLDLVTHKICLSSHIGDR